MYFYKQRQKIASYILFLIRNHKGKKGESIHPRGYWLSDEDSSPYFFDKKLAVQLLDIFKGSSVVDFGCGGGDYVRFLVDNKIESIGYDGNPATTKFSDGLCRIRDLTETFLLDKKYDWVLSLEVGEHIPRKYEKTFIDNILNHAEKGVVLSWAIPGQLGVGHVNLRKNNYIKKIFKKKGFKNNIKLENHLRNSAELGWFKNTIMVFEK